MSIKKVSAALDKLLSEDITIQQEGYNELVGFIHYLVGKYASYLTQDEKEEIIQESFCRICAGMNYYNSDLSNIATFVYTIVRNAITYYTYQKNKQAVEIPMEGIEDPVFFLHFVKNDNIETKDEQDFYLRTFFRLLELKPDWDFSGNLKFGSPHIAEVNLTPAFCFVFFIACRFKFSIKLTLLSYLIFGENTPFVFYLFSNFSKFPSYKNLMRTYEFSQDVYNNIDRPLFKSKIGIVNKVLAILRELRGDDGIIRVPLVDTLEELESLIKRDKTDIEVFKENLFKVFHNYSLFEERSFV